MSSSATLTPVLIQKARDALALGQAHLQEKRPQQALALFQQVARICPDVPAIYGLIGDALDQLGHRKEAGQWYKQSLTMDPSQLAVWNNFGNSLRYQSRYREAITAYESALELAADHPVVWKNLGLCFQYENDPDKATECMLKAMKLAPGRLSFRWNHARVLPITYTDEAQRTRYRAAYRVGLKGIAAAAEVDPDPNAIWDAFHLHYQGRNDRELQGLHGQIIHQIMAKHFPTFSQPLPRKKHHSAPIRVGFASSMLRHHTITYLFGSWLKGLTARGFDVYGYLVGSPMDSVSRTLAQSCVSFKSLSEDTSMCASAIRKDNLDVLIYPELGMNRHLLKLAALRLAPTQAVTWGHPVTTGLPTIDTFLSSEAMEPTGGDAHYSEQLVRLPGLSLFLSELKTPPLSKSRSDFGLPEAGTLFLIPQSLFKLTPEHDWIYGAIARNLPDAHFCFIANAAAQSTEGATQTVRRRLERSFAIASGTNRFTFLPGQSHEDFLALNQCADVFLDAPGWSGGRTTLEALSCGLVPITCTGTLMRQRHTSAILNEMGLPDLIAQTPEAYVDLATRLGADRHWRRQLQKELAERIPKLLDRQDVLDALADFCKASRDQ